MNWFERLYRVGLLIAAALVVAGAALAYRGVAVSLEAEHTLHANNLVLEVVTAHLENDNAEWPNSWDELTVTVPTRQRGMYSWPDDLEELQQRVKIDFSLTTADVSTMDPATFSAIAPIGPYYQVTDNRVESLLQAARQRTSPKQTTSP
jgi:hypothetical protein